MKDRRLHRLAMSLFFLGIAGALILWKLRITWGDVLGYWHGVEFVLAQYPVVLFLALVILPGLPIPTSALLLLAGTVWKSHPVFGCGVAVLAMTLNMVWTYAFAAFGARSWVSRMIASYQLKLPDDRTTRPKQWIFLMRLTPGMPFFLQNYVLGFIRVPFWTYLPWSIACNAILTCGLVLSGAGLSQGSLKPMMVGLGLIVVSSITVQWLRARKLQRQSHVDVQ